MKSEKQDIECIEKLEAEIKDIVHLLSTHEISKADAIKDLLNLHNSRFSLPDNLEEEIRNSKRFRKKDWTNLDGINYLKMMPDTEIAKMVKDIVKKSEIRDNNSDIIEIVTSCFPNDKEIEVHSNLHSDDLSFKPNTYSSFKEGMEACIEFIKEKINFSLSIQK